MLARLLAGVLTVSGALLGAISIGVSPSWAHQDGCHRWHSCPSDSGSYICGDLGYDDECPGRGGGAAEEVPEPEPVYDFEPPRRPRLTSVGSGAHGLVRFAVQAETGSRVVVRTGSTTVASLTATGAMQYLTFRATTGAHTYRATAADASGNRSTVGSVTVRADATPPPAAVDLRRATARDVRSVFSLTTEAGSQYRMLVDGRPIRQGVVESDGLIKRLMELGDGTHRIVVFLTDHVGNQRVVSRAFEVAVPRLDVSLQALSRVQDSTQLFQVAGTPGARVTLRIPRGPSKTTRTHATGLAKVAFDLDDGMYASPIATLVDRNGRRGTARLARFVVDTVAPDLRASTVKSSATVGLLALVIAGEQGSDIAWVVEDAAGRTVRSARYTSQATARHLKWDLPEGKYQVKVTATDQNGNKRTRTFVARVSADPVTAGDLVLGLVTIVALGLLLFLVGWLLWRNRHKLSHWRQARAERVAERVREREFASVMRLYNAKVEQHVVETARYRQADTAWVEQRRLLTTLHELARSSSGTAVPDFDKVKLKPSERVFTTVPGALIDMRSRQNVPYPAVVDHGTITITSIRVVFNGTKRREWAWTKLENLTHVGADQTMMKVTNRKTLSGISYSNARTTRTYLDIAVADTDGTRHRLVEALGNELHRHERSRPQPPAPLGPPPTRLARGSGTNPDRMATGPMS